MDRIGRHRQLGEFESAENQQGNIVLVQLQTHAVPNSDSWEYLRDGNPVDKFDSQKEARIDYVDSAT
jgi:hypothetical protein